MAQSDLVSSRLKLFVIVRCVQSSKIFTCNAPYPVDVFVRLNLRERGWVEKFGPRITLGPTTVSTVTTDRVLQCKSDKGWLLYIHVIYKFYHIDDWVIGDNDPVNLWIRHCS